MGSIGKTVFGGSDSKGSSQSGFAMLPKEIQDAFKQYGTQVTGAFKSPQTAAFTPMAQTADETAAFNMARSGLGSEQNFLSNIAMQMNPFDEYVISDINRQAQGANSLVNQAGAQAGQIGSNRNFLASSDVEQQRLNNIGQFRQGQYNTAVSNALGPLANLQQQDIQNLLGIGGFQRGLQQQTSQAPLNALQFFGQLLGALPSDGGSTSTQKSSSTGGLASFF